jgi:hypothetical protein
MDVQSVNDVTSLNFVIQTGILVLFLLLTLTDISTIYFEVSRKDCDKSGDGVGVKNAFCWQLT